MAKRPGRPTRKQKIETVADARAALARPKQIEYLRHTSDNNGPMRIRKSDWPSDSFEVLSTEQWRNLQDAVNTINTLINSSPLIELVDIDDYVD